MDSIVSNSNQLSSIINNNQQKDEKFSKRDLHYARRIGQIEEMSENVSTIKDKLTALDVKFDLRIPDKLLTEKKFEEETLEGRDILVEINAIRKSVEELEKAITNKQQLTAIETIKESTDKIEFDLRETEIRKIIRQDRLTTEELGKRVGLSRSRTNQILLEMQTKGLVSRAKYGKKYLWTVTDNSREVKLTHFH